MEVCKYFVLSFRYLYLYCFFFIVIIIIIIYAFYPTYPALGLMNFTLDGMPQLSLPELTNGKYKGKVDILVTLT